MIKLNENFRYVLHEEAAIEDFDDGSLVFLCKQLQLIEINKTARKILEMMDGKQNLKKIIKSTALNFRISEEEAREDILRLVDEMGSKGVLKPIVKLRMNGRRKMEKKTNFLANPDVSFREENEDGALLFNPDTDALQIINPIGQLIWKFLTAHPRTRDDVIGHIKEMCEDVPDDKVEADVDEFLKDLHNKGFIGEVVDD
jgi:hypothetical protein